MSRPFSTVLIALTASAAISAAQAATAERSVAGHLPDGSDIVAIDFKSGSGVTARVISFGATLQNLTGPDRNGVEKDVLVGFGGAEDYVERPNFFGATVGRVANRIAGGRFTLDGKSYQLPLNDNGNSLHGGNLGFDKKNWKIDAIQSGGAVASASFALISPDGDQGYPGTFTAMVTYSMDDSGALTIAFDGKTDKPTIVNMTNHAIFNLAGEGSPDGVLRHRLMIPASAYTPVSAALIPTGTLQPVSNTVFDFRKPRILSDGIRDGADQQIIFGRGYDHNFVLDKGQTATPALAARLEDPASGRVLEVLSTEPGLQVYTGNFLNGTVAGKHGHLYRMGDGIALEPQKFPDTVNRPSFGSVRVDPQHPYRHVMIYRLSVAK